MNKSFTKAIVTIWHFDIHMAIQPYMVTWMLILKDYILNLSSAWCMHGYINETMMMMLSIFNLFSRSWKLRYTNGTWLEGHCLWFKARWAIGSRYDSAIQKRLWGCQAIIVILSVVIRMKLSSKVLTNQSVKPQSITSYI